MLTHIQPSDCCLYAGQVMHHRFQPRRHRFIYRVVSWLIDLDRLDSLNQRLRLFSVGRFNLFAFYPGDHGDGSKTPLQQQIRDRMAAANIDAQGAIKLLCYPRILGYVFNPLSVYFCHNREGQLSAVLYEVSNTFGERHSYLIEAPSERQGDALRQQCPKALYVSPFMPMNAHYRFRIVPPDKRVSVCIRQCDSDGSSLLHATFTGKRQPLTDARLVRTFLLYPLMTVKVIAGIHWEALRLWRKGVPLQPRVAAPSQPITLIRTARTSADETV
ncbi:MAG: DUF1365 domain-containing protein [Oceanospirillales bacterium]|nr:DUF1365 domain-containing protein [Oceanospirillales bacterium]